MSTQSAATVKDVEFASVPGIQLQVPQPLDSTPQNVEDSDGNDSALQLTVAPGPVIVTTQLGIDITPQNALHVGSDQTVRFELGASNALSLGGAGMLSVDAPNIPSGRFVVTNTGNVGINQPNPQYTLDVNGTVNAAGLNLSGSVAFPGMLSESQAGGATLQIVYIDPQTGTLYYND
jgi:hypothetical protein